MVIFWTHGHILALLPKFALAVMVDLVVNFDVVLNFDLYV